MADALGQREDCKKKQREAYVCTRLDVLPNSGRSLLEISSSDLASATGNRCVHRAAALSARRSAGVVRKDNNSLRNTQRTGSQDSSGRDGARRNARENGEVPKQTSGASAVAEYQTGR